MRARVLAMGALLVPALFAGCTLDGHCYQSSAEWTEQTLFGAVRATATRETFPDSGLPASDTWIPDLWPYASVESITWLPFALGDRFEEPGSGLEFRPEPTIQLFASREEYGIRAGWPHSYPYGPRIEIPAHPFLVVAITEPDTPAGLSGEIIAFLDRLGVAPETHDEILAHLEAHKEKHTGRHDPATGEDTWKYGYWAPIPDLPPLERFVEPWQGAARPESHFVGWTDLVLDPQAKIVLDQPVRHVRLPSSIGPLTVDVDGAGYVKAMSPEHYAGDESAFLRALEEAFRKAGLPLTGLENATPERRLEC